MKDKLFVDFIDNDLENYGIEEHPNFDDYGLLYNEGCFRGSKKGLANLREDEYEMHFSSNNFTLNVINQDGKRVLEITPENIHGVLGVASREGFTLPYDWEEKLRKLQEQVFGNPLTIQRGEEFIYFEPNRFSGVISNTLLPS